MLKWHSPLQEAPLVQPHATEKSGETPAAPASCPHSQHPSTGLTVCNRLSLGRGGMGVSVSKPQSALLDKQTSQPLPTPPSGKSCCSMSSIASSSATGWWQAGIWCGGQTDAVTGKRHEENIITEGHRNRHHHHSPHLYNILNCHGHKMSKQVSRS